MRPVVCMITDNRSDDDVVVARAAAAGAAGVHLIQIRESRLEGGALLRLTGRCLEAVRGTAARVVVNDRLDVALAAGAHGVHLRSDGVDATRVRAIAPPGFLIGRSVHDVAAAIRTATAGATDYLQFGTVFETSSKPGRTAVGISVLRRVVQATALPVLAVGGADPEGWPHVARAGAAGYAAIGWFTRTPSERWASALAAERQLFDTPGSDP